MRNWVYLFFVMCLCVCGCADEQLSQPMEMVFFGGGDADVAAESTITGVPEDVQLLVWGDRDALVEELLGLPESYEALGIVFGYGKLSGAEARKEWLLDQICLIERQQDYYTKYIEAGGIAIMGNWTVDDAHFYNARDVILIMTSKRPELRAPLTPQGDKKFRIILFSLERYGDPSAPPETMAFPPSIPEYPGGHNHAGWCGWTSCKVGVQANPSPESWGRLGGGAYSILIHEVGHAIHDAINALDPTFQARLEASYAAAYANAAEAWPSPLGHLEQYSKRSYAMTNVMEYWAEGVSDWFGYVTVEVFEGEWLYRDMILKRDPVLYALLDEWLPFIDLKEVD